MLFVKGKIVMKKIYSCEGRHFKVYDSAIKKVLEHDPDTESVDLDFLLDDQYLWIEVSGYYETDMRVPGQKLRLDLYIFQDLFEPILPILNDELKALGINQNPPTTWFYGNPVPRENRQGVPRLVKLAEISNTSFKAPFSNQDLILYDAVTVVDSEIPGDDQTRWRREGGSRQIHFGIFNGKKKVRDPENINSVRIVIPINQLLHDFIRPIQQNWVE